MGLQYALVPDIAASEASAIGSSSSMASVSLPLLFLAREIDAALAAAEVAFGTLVEVPWAAAATAVRVLSFFPRFLTA